MPGFSPPPILVNLDPTKVGYEFLGAAPGKAGLAGIVAERVGHVHPLGRTIRQTAGMGLYQDITATQDAVDAYLTTNVGALPALGAWTYETWFWGGNGVIGGGQIGWFLGFYAQGNVVSTPNPDQTGSRIAIGFVNQGGGGGGAQFVCHDGSAITMTGATAAWNHFAAVWDGLAYHAFCNGTLVGSHTPSSAPSLAALLLGLGAVQTGTFTGRIRVAQTRLSSVPRYSATFTPAQVPFIPDANTVGLWNYSDVPLGNWGVYYLTGGSSPAPGGQPLASGWHWTPSVAFDGSGNGRDLGVALFVGPFGGDKGSCIYSAGVAGITAADAVVASPAVTSLQAMTGDVQLQDSTGAALAPAPGNPGVVKLPAIPALDTNAADIQPVAGAAAAGATGKGTDAGHQHVGVHSVTAGTNVTLGGTASDPVINASGGGGGGAGTLGSGLLADTVYDPNPIQTKTPGASLAAVDSANLSVTFTAPASGRVLVILTGSARASNNVNGDWLGWGLVTHGTTTLVSTLINALQAVNNPGGDSQPEPNVSTRHLITGLTPGTAYSLDWAYQVSGTGSAQPVVILGNNGTIHNPAMIEVYDATIQGQGGGGTPAFSTTSATVAATESSSSVPYIDLTTPGPAVTIVVPNSGRVWVELAAELEGGVQGYMGVALSGANTLAASDQYALGLAGQYEKQTYRRLYSGLTPGSTTFTAKYSSLLGGSVTWARRELTVSPVDGDNAFPAGGDTAWTAPTLQNGYTNFGGGFSTAGFRKDALGVVRLRGTLAAGTTTAGTVVFTLPAGYRPGMKGLYAGLGNNAVMPWQVDTNGQVSVNITAPANVELDGITFLAEQ